MTKIALIDGKRVRGGASRLPSFLRREKDEEEGINGHPLPEEGTKMGIDLSNKTNPRMVGLTGNQQESDQTAQR